MQALSFVHSVAFGATTFFAGGLLLADAVKWSELIFLRRDDQPIEKSLSARLTIGGLATTLLAGGVNTLNTVPKILSAAGVIGLMGLYIGSTILGPTSPGPTSPGPNE